MISCTNIYEKKIPEIFGVHEVSIKSSRRYESHAIGEWYVLESYVLSNETLQDIVTAIKLNSCGTERHPSLMGYYWIGWKSLLSPYSIRDVLMESTSFSSNNKLVQQYGTCCHNGLGYYTIIIKDSTALYDDLYEKTVVVLDIETSTLYICNYHY